MCVPRDECLWKGVELKNESRSRQSWMRSKQINSPSVGKHGAAKPQTGNSAQSKRVTAVSFSKWERGCRMCCFYQGHVSEFEHGLPTAAPIFSLPPPSFAAPRQWKRRSPPPTLFFSTTCPMWSIQISLNWFTGPAGSAHPQFIPTLFKIREVLGEGQDINPCTCANGVPADLWQRL